MRSERGYARLARRVRELKAAGELEEARSHAHSFITRNPAHADGRLLLAETLIAGGRDADAYEQLIRGVIADAENPEILVQVCIALVPMGYIDAAQELVQHAQEIRPSDFWLEPELVDLRARLATFEPSGREQAVRLFRQAISMRPDSGIFLGHFMGYLEELGDIAGAIAVYEQGSTAIHADRELRQRYLKLRGSGSDG